MLPQPGLLQALTGTDIHESTFPSPFEEPIFATFDSVPMETPIFNDLLTPLGDTKVLASYANSYFSGAAALTEHAVGAGKGLHFGSTFSQKNVKQLLTYLGILEPFQDLIQAPPEVQVIMREKDGQKYLFALNYKSEPKEIILKKPMHSLFSDTTISGTYMLQKYESIVLRV